MRVLGVCSALGVGLVVYGCAAGGSSQTAGFGDDGGTTGDDASVFVDSATGTDSGGDAAMDSGPLKTCVHTDDCTAPNLCTGTNGVACMGGFCVPTGKPMNCDDGVACTDDSCDANANKCKHTPNDASCPNGSYCDPTSNCVQTLPCMVMNDTVCDRLNTSACDGLWSCDTVRKYCAHAPKPCQDRANATTMCSAMGQTATCTWACQMGYVDLNGDLQAMGTSNGCECHITDAVDKPTLAMVDGNCDGIVGNKAQAIFVDTVGGNDGNPGTMAMPKKTIQAGIGAASASNPVKDVYVSKGSYGESVQMSNGVSIYGGYDAANGWARSMTNATTINSPTPVGAVTAVSLTTAVEIQLFSITSPDANGTSVTGDGMSSYGVVAAGSTGGVTVRGCTITVGRGAAGTAGADGTQGTSGSRGTDGASGSGGGGGCNGANGGPGGPAVGCTAGGNSGTAGTGLGGFNGAGGAPGSGGATGGCGGTSSSSGGNAPPDTSVPGSGSPGGNGNAGAAFGAFDTQGIYVPAIGTDGLQGFTGGGGGGGGSGGGSAHGTNFFCTDCSCIASGAGGGGGGGGCGGAPGHGGRGGGGSFAVVAVSTPLTIDATHMTTAAGGSGGRGGNGGAGGGGGGGGTGQQGQTASSHCSTRSGGNGADGVQGGSGGQGGGAGGGSGGPSACIVWKGNSPTATNNQCSLGGGGLGGAGGSNGSSTGQTGAQGQSQDTINAP